MEERPNRKLSKQEQARYEGYQRLCQRMAERGYRRVDLTVDVVKANVLAVVIMLPFLVVAAVLFFVKNPQGGIYFSMTEMLLFLVAAFVLVVLHEVIHGLTWALIAPRGFGAIAFGVIWQMLTPYCTCKDGLKRWQYLLGGLMPTLILGFGLAGLSTLMGSLGLFLLAELMILGGGGDFLIALKLLRYHPHKADVVYYDHPLECGLVAFELADSETAAG